MKNFIFIVATMIAFTTTNINAQSTLQTTALAVSTVEMIATNDMTLVTAQSELSNYLSANVQYPAQFVEYAITGTSTVAITLNANGSIASYEITKSLGSLFDIEIHKALDKLENINTSSKTNNEYTVVMPIRFTM